MSLSSLFFLAVIASVPLQLNKFFFANHSYVLGIPIDYRAIAVYLSDLVIVSYLALTIYRFVRPGQPNFKRHYQKNQGLFWTLMLFNLFLFLTALLNSQSPGASTWASFKVFEFSLLAVCASVSLSHKKVLRLASVVLTLSIFWQAIVILSQFLLQRSIGLWFLGERSFDATTSAIAHVQIFGNLYLRSYGTFPHPNVASAFLTIGLIITTVYHLGSKLAKGAKLKSFWPQILFGAISSLGVFLTFSRATSAVIIIGLIVAAQILKKSLRILLILTILVLAISAGAFHQRQIVSLAERLTLSQAALVVFSEKPLLGVGSANFILKLASLDLFSAAEIRLLQPVHNVFLLILAENGLIGFLIFCLLLFQVARKINSRLKLILFLALMVYASVDHFLWTLQQGQLLFWLTIAYIVSSPKITRA